MTSWRLEDLTLEERVWLLAGAWIAANGRPPPIAPEALREAIKGRSSP